MSRHVETATLYGKYHGKLALRQDVFYITFRADGDSWPYQYYHTSWGFCHIYNIFIYIYNWLVISTPLKNISQFGWLFPIYGKNKKCSKPPTSIKIAKSQKKTTCCIQLLLPPPNRRKCQRQHLHSAMATASAAVVAATHRGQLTS